MKCKYTLRDFLLASPYNMDTNFEGELSEELFYKYFFVKSSSYDVLNKKMNWLLNSNHKLESNIYLYGYSGTGKSTYLRWYTKNQIVSYNVVFFDMIDIVFSCNDDISEQSNKTRIKLFDRYFFALLCHIYARYPHTFDKLLSIVFESQLTLTNSIQPSFFNKLNVYLKDNDMNPTAFINLIHDCSYSDLLKLLLFFYFYYPTEFGNYFNIPVNNNLPLLIIFDNIDHIDLEYSNAHFPLVIESSYREILRDIRRYKISRDNDLEYNGEIRFIFCIRDANCSIINRQIADISIPHKVEFLPIEEESDILIKRISNASENNVQIHKEVYEFLMNIIQDEYTKRSFLPLFNYNIRKLALFILDTAREMDLTYIKEIKLLSKSNSTRYGSRGIEYFLIIRHLLYNDFLKEGLLLNDRSKFCGVNQGYVNPVRILLTNILNKSKYSLINFTTTTNKDSINCSSQVGLYNLFMSFNEIFKNEIDLFFDTLANLFLFHKENWCHLVTISNKQVFSVDDFYHEKNILEQLTTRNNPHMEAYKRELNNIKVQLNPSGYIYIRDITRHYEFFSVRANNDNPLFCSLGYEIKKDGIEFEFIRNIKKTFYLTKECLECLISFLNAGAVERFSSSVHCFRIYDEGDFLDEQKSSLHSVRIIDTHISYIDTFRLFILNNYKFLRSLGVTNVETVQRKINKDILDIIEQYISLLNKIEDGGWDTRNMFYTFSQNIYTIKKSDYTDCETSINSGRR